MNAPKRPKIKARLEQLITQWQKDSGQPVARLNLRVAAMMLAGAHGFTFRRSEIDQLPFRPGVRTLRVQVGFARKVL